MTGFALSLVPPTERTSGSEAGRLTSLTGADEPRRVVIAPPSPELATTVAWRATAYSRAELMVATSAVVKRFSPYSWGHKITSPSAAAIRRAVLNMAANSAGVVMWASSTMTSRIVASGATACTISVSPTSSAGGQPRRDGTRQGRLDLDACRGQPEPAVEVGQVPADVGDRRRRCGSGSRVLHQHHGLAAAVDPGIQQGLDAVRHPELVWRVTS